MYLMFSFSKTFAAYDQSDVVGPHFLESLVEQPALRVLRTASLVHRAGTS